MLKFQTEFKFFRYEHVIYALEISELGLPIFRITLSYVNNIYGYRWEILHRLDYLSFGFSSYHVILKEFTETLTSNSYTLKLIVEKDERQYFYREREYEFKKISDTQIRLHEIHTEIDGAERKEINETITLTKI